MMSRTEISNIKKKKQQFFADVDQKKDVINFLDTYSLAEIFMLLPIPDRMAMEKVCPKWKEASKLAWSHIKKYECSHSIGRAYKDQLLTQSYVKKLLLRFGIYLKELSLSKICNSSIMPMIGRHCKYLTRLEFSFNQSLKVNTNDYIRAFKKLDKLKFIKIKSTPLRYREQTKLNHEILDSLPKEINEIHLINQSNTFETPVIFKLKKYKHLHRLTLRGWIVDNIIQQISEQISLVYLDLKYSLVTKKCTFTDTYIFNRLVNLEHFYCLDYWKKITSNSPCTMFNTCPNMRYFNGSTGESCHILPENWVNLEKLEDFTIYWILNDELALNIVKYCKNLKNLNIQHATEKDILAKLTELENLERLLYPLSEISIESVNAIVTNCKKLKHLSTKWCEDRGYDHYFDHNDLEDGVGDFNFDVGEYYNDMNDNTDDDSDDRVPSASVFDELSKLEYLEYLNVEYVKNFRDSSLIAIAKKCKNLEYLNINNCKYITEEGLNFVTKIKSLRRLNVSYLKCVTDSFLGKLKRLNLLDCGDCQNVTDVGIIQFIKNCPDLEHLFLQFSRMTIKTIIAADQVTKYRKNNIVLHIYVTREEFKKAFKSKIKSKWLVASYL